MSGHLVGIFGYWIGSPGLSKERKLSNLKQYKLGRDLSVNVSSSVRENLSRLAVDGISHTRWSTGRPQQAGDWFLVELEKELELVAVELEVAANPADYPRGLAVEISQDGKYFFSVFSQENWLGGLRWSPDGYPYLSAQSDVEVQLPKKTRTRYLRFTQLSNSPHFDWSINDIHLYVAND